MEKLYPQDDLLKKYIDYYWVVDKDAPVLNQRQLIFDFPALAPDLVVGVDGFFVLWYKNVRYVVRNNLLSAFVDNHVRIDVSHVRRALLVRFQPLGLASLMPFTTCDASHLRTHHILRAHSVLDSSLFQLENELKYDDRDDLIDQLDDWFKRKFKSQRTSFLVGIQHLLTPTSSVHELKKLTGLSYSTLERRFKNETGISPKQFLLLNRFKQALSVIDPSSKKDWFDLVVDFGYHDQNHFIKEIKRFSGFTPNQLLRISNLQTYRPDPTDEFLL